EITIDFEHAAFGTKRDIIIQRQENCDTCKGTGAKPGTNPETCPECKGSGQVKSRTNTLLGSILNVHTCQRCKGTGKIVKDQCPTCLGTGRVRKTRTVTINVPAGIDSGQGITLRGEGDAGINGGLNGDLIIYFKVKPHKIFQRKGYDLSFDYDITFTQAALGDTVEIPTLNETIKYTIPAGTQPGTVFKIKNKGIKRINDLGYGDLYMRVNVTVPKKLTSKQKNLLKQLDETLRG
ncbi:MAG TPA: DnaJ C-terminal domain-containing protein, partial [Clostridia bacterium]|nr:DnaJ C-terminal domain-containing protein [Clostridia bacterium]